MPFTVCTVAILIVFGLPLTLWGLSMLVSVVAGVLGLLGL
jgi:hypothetical protein